MSGDERAGAAADEALLAQSRALGDRTRLTIFTHLRDAPHPLGVAELAERLGVHPNAVRQHLDKLVAAGLVVEQTERRTGRGRPRLHYRPVPGAAERWGGAGPYQTLAMLLLDLVGSGRTPRQVGWRAGYRLAVEHGLMTDSVGALEAAARQLGFEPRRETTGGGVDVVLQRCPFADAAAAAPEIVCELHHGLAEGITERVGDGARVTDLVVRPPQVAGCRLAVTPGP